jgi:molybdate transport system regulatory protein
MMHEAPDPDRKMSPEAVSCDVPEIRPGPAGTACDGAGADEGMDGQAARSGAALSKPRLRLRLCYPDGVMLGPGKADLLEGIAETGSIAAAGRRMGMSYKRAWSLVETMNAAFREPLVLRSRGGAQGGGAVLTDTGRTVLDHYRRIQQRAAQAVQKDVAAITALMHGGEGNGT